MATTLRSGLATLAGRITTPLLPADYLDVINPLFSGAQLRGRIVAIRPETRDAVTVVIKPGRGWTGHIPGQYLRLGVEVDGVRHWRTYSLTSRPGDRFLSITVKAVPGGVVSNHLVRNARAGTIMHLDAAAGDFTLTSPAPEKILFITAGSGITPVMGMLRAMTAKADVVVVHSAPTAGDTIFRAELQEMSARKVARDAITANQDEYERTELLAMMEKEMLEAAENLDFERAARLRDRIKELESAPTLETKGTTNGARARS